MPPKIALDARLVARQSTGDSTYWLGLLQGLGEIKPLGKVWLLSDLPKPADLSLDADLFEWIHRPSRNSRWWSWVVFPRLVRQLGADLAHVQYSASPLLRTPFVNTVHDVSFFIGPGWFRPKDRLLLQTTVPSSARRARRVLTVSHASKADVVRHLGVQDSRVDVTYLAPHPGLARPTEPDAKQRAAAVGVAGPYALSVSTRWPRKNMDLAVRAFEGLDPTVPHRLVLTGKQGWGSAAEGTRISTPGYVDEPTLSALYTAADLYVCPSLYEGFGLPVVEAFALGCPVVVGPGGSLPEVAGDAACVLPDYRDETWTRAIEDLLRDPDRRRAMAEAGLKRARMFSWRSMAEGVWDCYAKALDQGEPSA